MCDDNTVGTFINLGFEDDRTGNHASWRSRAGAGQDPKTSLPQDRHMPPAGELTSCLPMSVLRKANGLHRPLAGQAEGHRSP